MKGTLMDMPKYESYKDSGIGPYGDVPAHWDSYPLCVKTKLKSISNTEGEDLLSIYLDRGVIKFNEVDAKRTNATSLDLSKYQLVEPGDFVLNNQQAWRGSVGVSIYRGIVSPAYLILSLSKDINSYYANYLFRDGSMVAHYLMSSKGVGTIQRNLYWPSLRRIPLFLPPLEEQEAIANFLNKKTAQIDQVTDIKEKQITLLKERKQIIIQNAVTKGLDPNVPMKDSGVEWIGEIPEHWEVKKLKYILALKSIKISSKESSLHYLGMESIESQTGNFLDITVEAEGLANYFEKGDILFGKLRPYLQKVHLAKINGICSTEFLIYSPTKQDGEFYTNFLISSQFINVVNSSTYGSKMPRANSDFIGNLKIVLPPLYEQKKIASFVKNTFKQIEQAIDLQQAQINKLKEYKASLINSAVTGKIKVV